jgi:hypothetical protein
MHTLGMNARGLRLLARMNSDRLLMGGTLALALGLGAYLGQLIA